MKNKCDYLNGRIKKRSHLQKFYQKMVKPKDITGNAEEEEEEAEEELFPKAMPLPLYPTQFLKKCSKPCILPSS